MIDLSGHDDRRTSVGGAERLLDAAERLLARKGIEGWSVREVTMAAGHRNSSAVAYHFRDRQGLIDAVWQRRTAPVNAQRAAMMADLERDGRLGDADGLVRAHILPIAAQISSQQPSYWARVNEARLTELPLHFRASVEKDLQRFDPAPALSVLMVLLAHLHAYVAQTRPDLAATRVGLYCRFVITSLATWERELEAGRREAADFPAYVEDLVRMATAILTTSAG